MKFVKVAMLGVLFAVLVCSSKALAIDLYGFGSYWDKEDVDGSWGGGGGLSLPLFTEHLRLDGRAYFFEKIDLGGGDDLTLTPFDFGLQVHLLPSSTFNPYVLGGVSFIYADADRIDVNSGVGGYLGGGLEWAMMSSFVKLFGEVVYRSKELGRDFGPDVNVSGFTTNLGLKLHF